MFVLLENQQGEVLLQRRPPVGIWGGLWSVPECPSDTDLPGWVEREYGLLIEVSEYQGCMRHTFSHFHLDITTVRALVKTSATCVREDKDLYWYRPGGDNRSLGMATPVKKLVEEMFNSNQEVG